MSCLASHPAALVALASLLRTVAAVNGGTAHNAQYVYTAGKKASTLGGKTAYSFSSASYEYTGMGGAECNLDFAPDGSLVYSPAFTTNGNGIAVSKDQGVTWSQIMPTTNTGRGQPVFRQEQDRFFFWTTSGPGYQFEYSDNQGKNWSAPLNGSHFDPISQDWAKLVSGPPVHSKLSRGVKEIMYYSAPDIISTPVPVQPVGPVQQHILKSTDKGATWQATKSGPTLNPLLSGGACAGPIHNLAGQELIIWGDGFVTPNGTLMFGLRRCQALSVAISDDEGDTWRLSDVPGSHLVPYKFGDLTYPTDGNVLAPEPISMDVSGTIYAIWVDKGYVLRMSKSTDYATTWSSPVVIAAPGPSAGENVMAYLPTLRQHATTAGRAALAYYASADGGKTYNAYVAESGNLHASKPTFRGIIANNLSQPMQHNQDGKWDQGYSNLASDLIEFMDVRYAPSNSGFGEDSIVGAFARAMCSAISSPVDYDTSSCVDGWNYTGQANSRWQGIVTIVKH